MKKRWITRGVPLALALIWMLVLTACAPAQQGESGPSETPEETPSVNPVEPGEPGAVQVSQTFRIVDGAEEGILLLADLEGGGGIYRLSVTDDIPVTLDGGSASADDLADGMEATVTYDGTILETWPGTLSQVYALAAATPVGGGYTDLCGFYLKVLDDLWQADEGLNGETVAIDLSQAPGGLTESEQAGIVWRFGELHDVQVLTATFDQLVEEGYITAEALDESDPDGPAFYQWEGGCLLTITPHETEGEEAYSLPVLRFDAEKWASSLGAYRFYDCSAVWPEFGGWSGYNVGEEMIS